LSENKLLFTKENLDFYLEKLAYAFQKNNGRQARAEIVLIGGAAILAGYDFRGSTNDIDAFVRTTSSMKSAINFVSDEYNLPSGWFNSDFIKTNSFSPKLAQYSKFYREINKNFIVRLISGEYLIAMKLCSFRSYKRDRSDILGVLQYHQNIGHPLSFEKIMQAFTNLYENKCVPSPDAIALLKSGLSASDAELRKLIQKTLERESQNKTLLKEFDSEHKGVLNSDNLNDILSALQEDDEPDHP